MSLKIYRWVYTTALALFVVFFVLINTGCDNSDFWGGALVGGTIAIALTDDDYYYYGHRHHNHYHHHRPHNRPNQPSHRPDRPHNPNRPNQPNRPPRHNILQPMNSHPSPHWNISNEDTSTNDRIYNFALRFDIDLNAAALFVKTMTDIQTGDIRKIKNIGLSVDDIKSVSALQLPHQAYINNMAMTLGIASSKAKNILIELIKEAQGQFRDTNSAAWQICQSTGLWSTPQRRNCNNIYAKDCGPSTGASMCVPQ